MESIYLKTFLEVMQTGSFTKAADQLCVTQSAVSRRIQFMETQYDCTLVDRGGPVLKPTSEGRLVMEKALIIMDIEKELSTGLSRLGKNRQFLFISTPTFGMVYLPDIIRKFLKGQPSLTDLNFVSDMPDNIMKGLNEGLFEIAVIEHQEGFDLGDFETVSLPGDDVVFVFSPDLQRPPGDVQLEELFKYTLFGRKAGCCSRILETNLEKSGHSIQDFKRHVVVENLETLIELILKGEGISFISNDLVGPYIDSGQLFEIRVPDFVHERKRTLVFSPHSPDCSHIQSFADQILNHFGKGKSEKLSLPKAI